MNIKRFFLSIFLVVLLLALGLSILAQDPTELLKEKKYAEAIAVYQAILKENPNDQVALYNTACAYALWNKKKQAVEYLTKAIDAGFVDFDHIEADADLENIRKYSGYKKLMQRKEELSEKAEKPVGQLISIPKKLPPHPRLLLNKKEIRALRKASWTGRILANIIRSARSNPVPCRKIRDLGLAYQLTGKRQYAEECAKMLLGYVDYARTRQRTNMAGFLTDATLDEANDIVDLCWGYDLIVPAKVLTEEQQKTIENEVFIKSGQIAGHTCNHWNSGNWRARAIVVLAATGFVTGDRALINEALNGVYEPQFNAYLYGFAQHITHAIRSDGTYWETCIGYSYLSLFSMVWVAEMAKHSGIDLWKVELPRLRKAPAAARQQDVGAAGPGALRFALDALMYRSFPGMKVSMTGNSTHEELDNWQHIFEMGYRHTRDPKYAAVVQHDRRKKGGGARDVWALVGYVKKLPKGKFSFKPNADIAVNGLHRNGCTLLPEGGYAIMRGNGDDKDATCFETHYGLRINSHDHSDRLGVTLYGLGEIMAPDAGKKGYGSGLQLNWMVQSIAHNTVTINETTQYPQGDHNTVWVDPIPGRPPEGKLVFFHAGKKFKAIRAMTDKVYEGCVLDRTLILINPFVIDIFRVTCDTESQIDWAWHGYGKAKSKRKLAQQGGSLSGRKGYMHLTNPASAVSGKDWDVTWTEGSRRMRLFQVGEENTTHVLAQSPSGTNRPRMSAISRRHGKETIFVSVIEPYKSGSKIRGLSYQISEDNKTITVKLSGKGKHVVVIPIEPGKGQLKGDDESGVGYAMYNGKLIKDKKPK